MVPTYRRNPAKLQIITDTDDLLKEIVTIAKKDLLLPRFNKIMNDFICDCRNLYICIHRANQLRIDESQQKVRRAELCQEADDIIAKIILQLQMLIDCFGIQVEALSKSCELACSIQKLLKGYSLLCK